MNQGQEPLRIGILTVSDRASAGLIQDEGGPAVRSALSSLAASVQQTATVPDDVEDIQAILVDWADRQNLDVVFTTGGTGLSTRDVTPEATLSVCTREVPGVAEAMRNSGLTQTPMAMLSRGIAALRGSTLIINLPGSPRGAQEGVEVVLPVLAHAVATIRGGRH